ncbi:MAG TPA: FKBP-type peptidyl-prolyl cis-trans isomerase [Xanthobacteraceae bacterium]|jgi:peptidylprolyl isomerase|nr:FKBP-type peptidyl-prolyl cis-trans isomerase [Xanthobacteraceae bacterium]
MRVLSRRVALATTLSLVATGVTAMSEAANAQPVTTTPSGLKIIDLKVGTGPSPKPGQTCVMNYTGWLYENGNKGKKFDSSLDRNQPFSFPIGQHQVIAGWDEGVAPMKVGGKRTLIIPPELGYGARGAGGVIPPNATLIFDVELLSVK